MTIQDWQKHFQEELNQAIAARQAGNEGKARVCARRAAGIVAGEYLSSHDLPDQGTSAYERLKYLQSSAATSLQVKEITSHFLVRVLPDHSLPIEADLIEDAHTLFKLLAPT